VFGIRCAVIHSSIIFPSKLRWFGSLVLATNKNVDLNKARNVDGVGLEARKSVNVTSSITRTTRTPRVYIFMYGIPVKQYQSKPNAIRGTCVQTLRHNNLYVCVRVSSSVYINCIIRVFRRRHGGIFYVHARGNRIVSSSLSKHISAHEVIPVDIASPHTLAKTIRRRNDRDSRTNLYDVSKRVNIVSPHDKFMCNPVRILYIKSLPWRTNRRTRRMPVFSVFATVL